MVTPPASTNSLISRFRTDTLLENQHQNHQGRDHKTQGRRLCMHPVKAVQHNLPVLLGAPSCCQRQVLPSSADKSTAPRITPYTAIRLTGAIFLVLLFILSQLITGLMSVSPPQPEYSRRPPRVDSLHHKLLSSLKEMGITAGIVVISRCHRSG